MSEENSWNSFLEGLGYYGRKYIEFSRKAGEWYAKVEPTIRRAAEVGGQVIEIFPVILARSSLTFARGGWSEVPLADMDLSEFSELVTRLAGKPDDEIKRELDRTIAEYFRQDDHARLSEMVAGWEEHFAEKRHRIFKDALWAHKQGRYTLSIPALAAQVEGIVRDLTGEYEGDRDWIRRFNEAFGLDYKPWDPPPPPDPEQVMTEFKALPIYERFQKVEELRTHFTLVRINELYDKGEFSDPDFTSLVKRHAILHGVFDNFGELESLRLFCILALLHHAVADYKKKVIPSQSDTP